MKYRRIEFAFFDKFLFNNICLFLNKNKELVNIFILNNNISIKNKITTHIEIDI